MNGVRPCLICHEQRSDWVLLGPVVVGGKMFYACEDHRVEGRAHLDNLRRLDSALTTARRQRKMKRK